MHLSDNQVEQFEDSLTEATLEAFLVAAEEADLDEEQTEAIKAECFDEDGELMVTDTISIVEIASELGEPWDC